MSESFRKNFIYRGLEHLEHNVVATRGVQYVMKTHS